MPNFISWVSPGGYYFRYGLRGAFGSLHVVLGSLGAACGIPLIEGDAFGFAHESELDVDAVEEFWRQEGCVGCTSCDGGEFIPVLADEWGIIDAEAWIKQPAGANEIEKTLLFGT